MLVDVHKKLLQTDKPDYENFSEQKLFIALFSLGRIWD